MLNAMLFLRLETATPTETEKTIGELERRLQERDQEIKATKETMTKMQPLIEFAYMFKTPEIMRKFLEAIKSSFPPQSLDVGSKIAIIIPNHILDEVEEIVKSKGITSEKALEQIINQSLKTKKGSKTD